MTDNNNQEIVKKLSKRSLKANVGHNLVLLTAIILSSFMLTAIFTVGISYYHSVREQSARMAGNSHDAMLTSPSEEQIRKCLNIGAVKHGGLYVNCASITENNEDKTLSVRLIWSDETNWKYQRTPAMEYVKGSYPENENEILLTAKAMKQMQIEDKKIGSQITVTYKDANGSHEKEFVISGICKDYTGAARAFVSEQFFHTTGHEATDTNAGYLCLTFKKPFLFKTEIRQIKEEISLGKRQELYLDEEMSFFFMRAVAGALGLSLLVLFSAGLLIYNVIYISICKDIRFYGLLKTIGMTKKQIRSMIHRQITLLGAAGIIGGCTLGAVFSFLLVPGILGAIAGYLNVRQVMFQPLIFIGVILFTAITLKVSSYKPAKLAGMISPVEAVKYTGVTLKKKRKNSRTGNRILQMAQDNLMREKKRTAVVLLSLTTGLTIFICMVVMIKSQGARNIVSSFTQADISLSNETFQFEENKDMVQKFDDSFFQSLENLEGIKEVHKVTSQYMMMPYKEGFADNWMKAFYQRWMRGSYEQDKAEYKKHPESFGGFLIGIDDAYFEKINETLKEPMKLEDFQKGETGILCKNDVDIKESNLYSQSITVGFPSLSSEEPHTIKIGGVSSYNYSMYSGIAPNIMVSDKVAERWFKEPLVESVDIVFQKEYDKVLDMDIKKLVKGDKDIGISSKTDQAKDMKSSQNEMMVLGGGLAIMLAFIGILNYINFMINGIQGRLTELWVLEGIGMTRKQIKKMLMLEGSGYGGIAILLTSTLGLGLVYLIFQSGNAMGADFSIPMIPVLLLYLVMMVLCILIPIIIYNGLGKKTIIEGIRELEKC